MVADDEAAARIEWEIGVLIRRAEVVGQQALAPDLLPRSAYLLLGEIVKRGPIGIAALADAVQLDVSTVSRQVGPLEARALVTRVANPEDGRGTLLTGTAEGIRRLDHTRSERRRRFEELLRDWTPEEQDRLADYLQRLNAAIGERVRLRRHLAEPAETPPH
jgi:DNA-binding MarR family transcriptional regulator